MKNIYRILFLIIYVTIGIVCTAKAQSINVAEDYFKGSTGIKSFTINDNIIFVSNNDDKLVEISSTKNSLQTNWKQQVSGYLHHADKLDNNIVVVVSTDYNYFTKSNSIFKAFLLDAKNGAVLKEKVLFDGNDDFYTLPKVVISHDKKKLTLFVRETLLKRTVKFASGTPVDYFLIKKMNNNFNANKQFQAITFSNKLDVIEHLFPDLEEGNFVGVAKTINNDMYIAMSKNKQGVTISKYESGKETAMKTHIEPYTYYSDFLPYAYLNEPIVFFADTLNNDVVYLNSSFKEKGKHISMFTKFNFVTGDHKRFVKSFSKESIKDLKKEFSPLDKPFNNLFLGVGNFIGLLSVHVVEDGCFLIMGDEHMVSGNNSGRYIGNSLLVYRTDNDLNVKSTTGIPRSYMHIFPSEIKTQKNKDFLYIAASHDTHAKFILAKLNIQTGKLEDLKLMEPSKKTSKSDIPGLKSAAFFDGNLVFPVLDNKLALTKQKFNVHLFQMPF